jgi:hypothetical protein
VRVQARYVDNDGGIPRVHVVLNGQDCGPSIPCSREWFEANQARFEMMLKELAKKSESVGVSNTKRAIRNATGA